MMTVILVLHFMVCFVLITVVLLQRGKGADLGAALGGGGANTVFGSRGAGNFLTKLTTGSAVVFMLTSLTLAYFDTHESEVALFDQKALEAEQEAEGAEAGLRQARRHAAVGRRQRRAAVQAGPRSLLIVAGLWSYR